MQGWQFTKIGAPLERVEFPDPAPGRDEVLIAVHACGLCHSDVGIMEGVSTGALGMCPIVLGHEIAGVVKALGEGVDDFRIGDRVAVRAGADSPGVVTHGGYADLVVAPTSMTTTIPENVTFQEAAVATDAGLTSYHALVHSGGLNAGDRVAIIGLGGLGLFAVQIAAARGAKVYGVDVRQSARDTVASLGVCDRIVSDAGDLADEGIDLVVDLAGMNTLGKAVEIVRPCGRIVQVGLGATKAEINVVLFTQKALSMIGSVGGTLEDLREVLALLSARKIKTRLEEITFEQIPQGLERLAHGGVDGRLVANIAPLCG